MQEIVYLSDAKLRQFMTRRQIRVPRVLRLSIPAAGLEIENGGPVPERDREHHLSKVVRHIEQSARWFQETDLMAGQWVYFEAPLTTVVLEHDPATAFFLDPPRPPLGYTRAGKFRVLLHGSSHHLTNGTSAPTVDNTALEQEYMSSSDSGYVTSARYLRRALDALSGIPLDTAIRPTLTAALAHETRDDSEGGPYARVWDPTRRRPAARASAEAVAQEGVRQFVQLIDKRASHWTAAWMRGYARVSAQLRARNGAWFLLASPLVVESAPELANATQRYVP